MSYKELQAECYEANVRLPQLGLVDLTFGNVSVIDRAKGVIAIKPSGVDYAQLTPEDMVLLDMEGKVIQGRYRPSSDAPTHRRLFLGFEKIRSVVHTHSRNAVVFAMAGMGIPCFNTTHADSFCGEIPVTRELKQAEVEGDYEWATGNSIVERFADLDPENIPAVLVKSHGPFTWGGSGAKAVENALVLEIVAEMARKAIQLNCATKRIPQYILEKHFFRKHGSNAYYGQAGGH